MTLIPTAFAAEAPTNFEITEVNSESVSLSWENIPLAVSYSIYYGTQSGSLDEYEIVEDSPYTITQLQKDTQYFINIRANDAEFNESEPSPTLEFVTQSFSLDTVDLISSNKLVLSFNNALENSPEAQREFKIVHSQDDLDIVEVLNTEIDPFQKNTLILTLSQNIPVSSEYNLTVISLKDTTGNNIENGIDALASFRSPTTYENINEEEIILDAAPVDEAIINEISGGSAWTNLTDDEIAVTTQTTAQNAQKLPDTGAEHWFLWILAVLLWALVFSFKFARNS